MKTFKVMLLTILASCSLAGSICAQPETTEVEKVKYLKNLIQPSTKLATSLALLAGIAGRYYLHTNKYVQIPCHYTFHKYIMRENVEINEDWQLSISRDPSASKHAFKNAEILEGVLGITRAALPLAIESALALALKKYVLKNDKIGTAIPMIGGIPGTLVYHLLSPNNKRCLTRTLETFKATPSDFPAAAQLILQNTAITFDTMSAQEIDQVCTDLRKITQPK